MYRKSKRCSVKLDEILVDLGQFGRYQRQKYFLIMVAVVVCAIHRSQYVFNAGKVKYRCRISECEEDPPKFDTKDWGKWAIPAGDSCHRYASTGGTCSPDNFNKKKITACGSWVYESHNTIVAEFNLACEEWKRTLVGTIHNAGVFVALGLTAFASDTFGRRGAFILTSVCAGASGLARSFVNSYTMYMVAEFVEALLGAGVYSTGYVLALEMVGLNYRVLGGNILSSTFAVGQICMAAIAWVIPYWRKLTRVIYAPALLFVFYIFFIDESVRWLLSKGYKEKAAEIIFKAAVVNNKTLSPASIKQLTEQDSTEQLNQPSGLVLNEKYEQRSLFKQVINSKTLVTRVIICSFWWITITFTYYGLSINSVSLAGNSYINYMLTSVVEIPGYVISVLTLDRFGRKASIITGFYICGSSLFAIPFVAREWAILLNLVGKLAISMIFASIYIYTIELFPTTARHSLMNTCSMIGRFGSMAAPQTPLLMEIWESLPYVIFGMMTGTAGLLMLLTPETLKIRLPDTVKEAEQIMTAPRTRKPRDVIVD